MNRHGVDRYRMLPPHQKVILDQLSSVAVFYENNVNKGIKPLLLSRRKQKYFKVLKWPRFGGDGQNRVARALKHRKRKQNKHTSAN